MTPSDRQPLHHTTTAIFWLAVVAIALMVASVSRLVQAQVGELPSPYPSETWTSPGVSNKPLFEAPPCAGSNDACQNHEPCFDPRAQLSPYSSDAFSPGSLWDQPYNACDELNVYGGKYLNPTQRPLVELGMPL